MVPLFQRAVCLWVFALLLAGPIPHALHHVHAHALNEQDSACISHRCSHHNDKASANPDRSQSTDAENLVDNEECCAVCHVLTQSSSPANVLLSFSQSELVAIFYEAARVRLFNPTAIGYQLRGPPAGRLA